MAGRCASNENGIPTLVCGYLLIVILAFMWGAPATAFARDPGVSWSHLSSDEKRALKRYSKQWENLSPSQQKRLQQGARKWNRMDPEQQKRIRSKYDRFRQMPAEEQERLRRTHRWYKNLPQDQKTDLKKRWNSRPTKKQPTRRK